MTFSDLESVFVTPFESNERRKILLSRLAAFTERLKEVPIDMEVWIDGSFATAKENPGDIDLVVAAFFKVVVIIRLVIKRLFFLDLDEPHQRVHSS